MKKRCMMLLMAGILLGGLSGCGNNRSADSMQEAEESMEDANESMEEVDDSIVETAKEPQDDESSEEETSDVVFAEAELTCVLPKGFEVHPEEPGLYVYKTYPIDISTISYIISEGDYDISSISKDEFEQNLEEDYFLTYGDQVDINITEYEKIKIDGRNGLRIMMSYEFKGVEYEQLMYSLYNGNESHIINFTQEKGGEWMDEFEQSGETISFTNTN